MPNVVIHEDVNYKVSSPKKAMIIKEFKTPSELILSNKKDEVLVGDNFSNNQPHILLKIMNEETKPKKEFLKKILQKKQKEKSSLLLNLPNILQSSNSVSVL